ncbi:hypothetical protein ACFX13_008682 [Malus domestica]
MLVSFAVSTRAGKEHLVPCCSFSSCRQGALVLPFMLVQTRSVVPCSLGSCEQGAFGVVLQFQLVQARSVGVAFYARADQERCAMQFRLV